MNKSLVNKFLVSLTVLLMYSGCSVDRPAGPNIFLVTVDTLRWDYLATYGFPESDISPAVDRLARNGTLFERAVATAGTTIPSHGSMLTGLYPRQHGARSNFHALNEGTPTIAASLSEAGYRTAAFFSVNWLGEVGQLNRGFQGDNLPFRVEDGMSQPQSGQETIRQVAGWLDDIDPEQPVFVWMHLWEPHSPYVMTDRVKAQLGDYDGLLKDGVTMDLFKNHVKEIVHSEDNLTAMRAIYAGEVNLADHYLGLFLSDLDARGLLTDSVVIFTADHGQSLGENLRLGHGATYRENVIRVPLIVADFRSRKVDRIATRVGIIDIAPTIADLAGLEKRFDWNGRSLMSLELLAPDFPYFVEVKLRTSKEFKENELQAGNYDPDALAVYSGDFKLTHQNGKYRLYETEIAQNGVRVIEDGNEPVLAEYLKGLVESFLDSELGWTETEISENNLRQLQGLGYVQ